MIDMRYDFASLVDTCKLTCVASYSWPANTLTASVTGLKRSRIDDLLPWNCAAKM